MGGWATVVIVGVSSAVSLNSPHGPVTGAMPATSRDATQVYCPTSVGVNVADVESPEPVIAQESVKT